MGEKKKYREQAVGYLKSRVKIARQLQNEYQIKRLEYMLFHALLTEEDKVFLKNCKISV
jgi:hypothetical protein